MSFPTVKLPPFRGLCKDFEPGTLLPGQSPDMQDIRLSIRREIEKMDGYATWTAVGDTVRGGFDFQKWDAVTRRVVVGSNTTVYMIGEKSNILTANQSNVETDTTGFTAIGAATMTRTTNIYYQGIASLSVVTGAVSGDGAKVDGVAASAATQYTASAYIKGTSGDTVKMVLRDNTNGTETTTTQVMNGLWQRVQVTHTMGAVAVTDLEVHFTNNAATNITFYVDAIQVEANSYAGHWTVGGTSGVSNILTATTDMSNFTTDGYWDFEQFDDLLIMANGFDVPYFWNGLSITAQTLSGDVWDLIQNRPVTVTLASEQVMGRYLYSVGGDAALATSYRYDPLGNNWITRASLIAGRDSCGSFILNEVFHIVGGDNAGGTPLATHETYQAGNNVFSSAASLGAANDNMGGAAEGIYGYLYTGLTTSLNTRYNTETNVWGARTVPTTLPFNHGSGYSSGRFWQIGGGVPGAQSVIESYVSDDNAWTTRQSLNAARYGGSSHTFTNDSIAYISGQEPGNSTRNEIINTADGYVVAAASIPSTFASGGTDCHGVYLNTALLGGGNSTSIARSYVPPNFHFACQFVVAHQGVLFTAGNKQTPARLAYTDLHEPRTQRSNAFIDLPVDRITSLFRYQNTLHALSRDKMVRVNGTRFDPDLTIGNQFVEEVPQAIGTTSHRSVVEVPLLGIMLWWSEYGPVMWDGTTITKLAERYRDGQPRGLLKFFTSTTDFNQAIPVVAFHRADRSEVWFSLTTSGTSRDDCYVYNYALDEFYGPINIAVRAAFEVEDLNTDMTMVMASNSTNVVRLGTTNAYSGAAINGRYRTDFMTFGDLLYLRSFDTLYTLAKQSGAWNLTIKHYRDWSTSVQATNTEVLSGTNKILATDLSGDPVNALQIEWSNANASEPFTVMGAELGIEPTPQQTV